MKAILMALFGVALSLQSEVSFAQANQSLSNLTSPTAINQDLIFDRNSYSRIETLGGWNISSQQLVIGTGTAYSTDYGSGNLMVSTGGAQGAAWSGYMDIVTGPSQEVSGDINMYTGPATNGVSGTVSISTGESYNSDSGNIVLTPGPAAGTQGIVNLQSKVQIGATSTTPQHELNTATATGSSTATMTNSPISGDPSGYIQITINGTQAYIPYWQ